MGIAPAYLTWHLALNGPGIDQKKVIGMPKGSQPAHLNAAGLEQTGAISSMG
jgi:hypothetical protein